VILECMVDDRPQADRLLVAELFGEARGRARWRELTVAEESAAVAALRELAGWPGRPAGRSGRHPGGHVGERTGRTRSPAGWRAVPPGGSRPGGDRGVDQGGAAPGVRGSLAGEFPLYLAADRVGGVPHCFPVVLQRLSFPERFLVKLGARAPGPLGHPDHGVGVLDPLGAFGPPVKQPLGLLAEPAEAFADGAAFFDGGDDGVFVEDGLDFAAGSCSRLVSALTSQVQLRTSPWVRPMLVVLTGAVAMIAERRESICSRRSRSWRRISSTVRSGRCWMAARQALDAAEPLEKPVRRAISSQVLPSLLSWTTWARRSWTRRAGRVGLAWPHTSYGPGNGPVSACP